MNAEQITTIITNVLTGSGIIIFLGMYIRGLRNQIGSLSKTVEIQQKTLEAMETRVLETEKIGKIYRQLFDELLTEAEKWKTAILKFKDERISVLEQANQSRDGKTANVVNVDTEKLLEFVDNIQKEISDYLIAYDAPPVKSWQENERTVKSHLAGYTNEDTRIALGVWRFLDGSSKPVALKEIASKLNLHEYVVSNVLNLLIKQECAQMIVSAIEPTKYRALIPNQ